MCAILCLENWHLQKNNFLLCCLQIAWITRNMFKYLKHIMLQYYHWIFIQQNEQYTTSNNAHLHFAYQLLLLSQWHPSPPLYLRQLCSQQPSLLHLSIKQHRISHNNHNHWNIQLNDSLYSVHSIRNTQRPFLAVELSAAAGGFPPAEMLDLAWVFTSDLAYDQTRQNKFIVQPVYTPTTSCIQSSNSKFHYYIAELLSRS